jgi:histidine ammonia-lyase
MLAVAGTAGGRAHGQGEAATTATRSDGEQPTSTSMSGAATASASDTSEQPPVQNPRTVVLTGDSMTIADIVDIAEGRATIEVSNDGMERIRAARAVVDHFIEEGLPAYGITTMYGADFQTTLPPDAMRRFGRINIIQEATRVGDGSLPVVDPGTMRAAWALLTNSYARGFSGASPDLVATLVDRVNMNHVPDDVEYENSMGDADLTANAQAAMSLLADPAFELKAGEATNLLTHNFIGVALAAQLVQRAEALLRSQQTALALSIEGFRANLSPLAEIGSRKDSSGSQQLLRRDLRALLDGSRLWQPGEARQLQDFLSLRDGIHTLATLRLELDQFVPLLESFANSNQGSPVVVVDKQELISVPDFDTSQVTIGLDGLRQALGLVVIGSNSRGLKLLSHPFIDLPSGLIAGDPDAFDGIYTRNITYIMTSLERAALIKTAPTLGLTESYMAEGDEDYSPAFPNSVLMAWKLIELVQKVSTLEALIGSVAIERRVRSGELTIDDIPPALRQVQSGIIQRSPLAIPIDQQYDLAPLFGYYAARFRR